MWRQRQFFICRRAADYRPMTHIALDRYKLMHWLNARKVTPGMVAKRAKLPPEAIQSLFDETMELGMAEAGRLADALHIPLKLLAAEEPLPSVIHATKAEINATCRRLDRDGIHFYNYYTLPSPKGLICPVILDILCPAERLPKQNNGHLEPAITVNIGPGDINGRWDGRHAEERNDDTWRMMRHNRGTESWILGDCYVEPSWCPHTYALAGAQPAQILSYTVKTSLEAFAARTNNWSDAAFDAMVATYDDDDRPFATAALAVLMERRGFNADSLAKASNIGLSELKGFLDGDENAIAVAGLRQIGDTLACDWRLLLAPVHRNDSLGKSWNSIEGATASIRPFKSYTVASMSMSARVPDMIGLFMKVEKPETHATLDLSELSATHYLVSGGALTLHWQEANGSPRSASLGNGDALWVGPYVRHAFTGTGSLVKLGNGEGVSALDQFELSNTFDLADTLKRGRRDRASWGYDNK